MSQQPDPSQWYFNQKGYHWGDASMQDCVATKIPRVLPCLTQKRGSWDFLSQSLLFRNHKQHRGLWLGILLCNAVGQKTRSQCSMALAHSGSTARLTLWYVQSLICSTTSPRARLEVILCFVVQTINVNSSHNPPPCVGGEFFQLSDIRMYLEILVLRGKNPKLGLYFSLRRL